MEKMMRMMRIDGLWTENIRGAFSRCFLVVC